MSPSKRQRPTTGKGKNGERANARSSGPAPLQRLGLLVFGVVFVALFAGFAIAQGLGYPSVPSGSVALVKGVPADLGNVTEVEFKRALIQAAGQAGVKSTPKPGDKQYEELKTSALGSLLDTIWIQGEAAEMGIEATPKEIETEFNTVKQQNFKTAAEYKKFLATSHLNQSEVDERVKLQIISKKIQEQIGKSAPTPSDSEVQDYYDAAKSTQFTQKPTRDVRIIVNKDAAKVAQAKVLLVKDDSAKSWKKVAAKYSLDPTTKSKGGLQAGLSEETLKEPLKAAVFGSAKGTVIGPVSYEGNNYVVEVEKLTPEKVQPLSEVKSQISSQMAQTAQQEEFTEFLAGYTSKWTSRTFCASDYTIERCANFKGTGHSASAPPACYEADAKGGIPDACPAPVQQLAPAIPGSVTILAPKGQPLPQRPQPEGLKPASEAEVPGVLPGAVPGATTAPPPSG